MHLLLRARPPFNYRSVVKSHGWYMLAPFTWDEPSSTLWRTERLHNGRVVHLALSACEQGVAVASAGRFGQRERREIAEKVTWIFMLDADFEAFYRLADVEPRLAHCRADAHGRLLRSPSIWEDLVKVMLTTNIQWSGTRRLVSALVNGFGARSTSDDERPSFPGPEAIARTRESTLRKLGLGYRAPYLLQLARAIVGGRFDLATLKDETRPTADVRGMLLQLPGIGPYAAATLLGFLGRYDYIGVDTEAISAVSRGFYDGKPVGAKQIDAVFARWGKFKALAYWFWDWDGQRQAPMDAYHARAAKANV